MPVPPTEEEVAAIVAAVMATQPVTVAAATGPERPPTPAWRFSARWWRKPIASRRDRPR
jgi:hypothetical protein